MIGEREALPIMPKEGKRYRTPSKILSASNLQSAWAGSRDSGRNPGAPGLDGQKAKQFGENLAKNIRLISSEIRRGEFRFQRLKPRFIPKGTDRWRVICVPSVRDRLVQRAIAEYLLKNDKLHVTSEISYGFTRGLTIWDAIERARVLREKNNWVLKTDISSFFDRIDRELLLESVGHRVRQSNIFPFLEQIVHSEIRTRSREERQRLKQERIITGRGLRQGMPLSPLLANCALKDFDQHVIAAGYSAVRYADDLIFFFSSRQECRQAHSQIVQLLAKLGHQIPGLDDLGSKTQMCQPQSPVEFLGIELAYSSSAGRYVSRVPLTASNRIAEDIISRGSLERCLKQQMDIVDFARRLAAVRSSYSGHYKKAENWPTLSKVVEQSCRKAFYQVLSEILGPEAMQSLTPEGAKFLGLSLIDELND